MVHARKVRRCGGGEGRQGALLIGFFRWPLNIHTYHTSKALQNKTGEPYSTDKIKNRPRVAWRNVPDARIKRAFASGGIFMYQNKQTRSFFFLHKAEPAGGMAALPPKPELRMYVHIIYNVITSIVAR